MKKIILKKGFQLTLHEIDQINQAKAREFRTPPVRKNDQRNGLFFLLKDHNDILAIGQLIPIEPVIFNQGTFSIIGIGGVVANVKGKGYGKQIILAIKDYLIANNKTGVGFCALRNKGFYEKCGFNVDTTSIKRFIFNTGGKKITNSGDDCVLYLDSADFFIRKVLFRPNIDVILPRPPDW